MDTISLTKVFNPNATTGEQLSFPVCPQHIPYQLSIQQGVANFSASTTAGILVILPKWAEKVMAWHYPQNPDTKTFGTVEQLPFTLDLDSYYSLYRMLSMSVSAVTSSLSAGSIAIGGMAGIVHTYNSLAYCVGNGSTVYQIYSYSNLPGLTPDTSAKLTGVPFWKGVGGWALGDVREKFNRLEDSATYAPSTEVNSAESICKFVNHTDCYSLQQVIQLNDGAGLEFSLDPGQAKTFDLGETLKDGLRASVIDWAVGMRFQTYSPDLTPIYQRGMSVSMRYEAYDLAGTVVNNGILFDESISFVGQNAAYDFNYNRSGSFPDLFNIKEAALTPPVRAIKYFLVIGNPDPSLATPLYVSFSPGARIHLNYLVPNGLTTGLTQNAIIIAYDGVEIGQQINVNCSVLLEAIPDSNTAKFTNPQYRKSKMKQEEAIMKIAANPLKYGVKWVAQGNQLEHMMLAFRQAVAFELAKDDEKLVEGLKLIKALQQQTKIQGDETQPAINEASARSIWKKVEKGLKSASKSTWNNVLKPVAQEELKRLKNLPKNAANHFLDTALTGLMMASCDNLDNIYTPPRNFYNTQTTSYVTPQAASGFIPQAASGFIPRASTEGRTKMKYVACVGDVEETEPQGVTTLDPKTAVDDPISFRAQVSSDDPCCHLAATKAPVIRETKEQAMERNSKLPLRKPEKDICNTVFTISSDCVTLFPTVNLTKEGDLQDDEKDSTVEIFAIVPKRLIIKPPIMPIIDLCGKRVYNYAFYDASRGIDKLSIPPSEDVCLLRVDSRKGNNLVLTTTTMPVGGRSLDLAMYAFNNKFFGNFVYTGHVEAGNIGHIADDMMLLKTKYIRDNNMVSVGNGSQYDINVPTLIKLCEVFRKSIKMTKSRKHYNAYVGLNLTGRDLNLSSNKDWYWIPKNCVVEEFDVISLKHFGLSSEQAFSDLCIFEPTNKFLVSGLMRECDFAPEGIPRKSVLAIRREKDADENGNALTIILIQMTFKQLHNLYKWVVAMGISQLDENTDDDFTYMSLGLNQSIPVATSKYPQPVSASLTPSSLFFTLLERTADDDFVKAKEIWIRKIGGNAQRGDEKLFKTLVQRLDNKVTADPYNSMNQKDLPQKATLIARKKESREKWLATQTPDALSMTSARRTLSKWAHGPEGLKNLLMTYSALVDQQNLTPSTYSYQETEYHFTPDSLQQVLKGKSEAMSIPKTQLQSDVSKIKVTNLNPFFLCGFNHYLTRRVASSSNREKTIKIEGKNQRQVQQVQQTLLAITDISKQAAEFQSLEKQEKSFSEPQSSNDQPAPELTEE